MLHYGEVGSVRIFFKKDISFRLEVVKWFFHKIEAQTIEIGVVMDLAK